MRIKGKKIENRTILIVLLVILIIVAGYYLITNSPVEVKYLTPDQVLSNKNKYLNGGEIVVRGYYDSNAVAIVSTMSTVEGKPSLRLNYDNVQNATDILRNGVKFDFAGTLQELNPGIPGSVVIFVASKIKPV